MKLRKLYRKTMRQLARWVLSYDRCPADYRKNYKEIMIMGIDILLVSIVFFIVTSWFVLVTM